MENGQCSHFQWCPLRRIWPAKPSPFLLAALSAFLKNAQNRLPGESRHPRPAAKKISAKKKKNTFLSASIIKSSNPVLRQSEDIFGLTNNGGLLYSYFG